MLPLWGALACSPRPAPPLLLRAVGAPSGASSTTTARPRDAAGQALPTAPADQADEGATGEAASEGRAARTLDTPATVCPPGMRHIQTSFCPQMKRACIDREYDRPNRITICRRYREGASECTAPRVPLDYCMDEFEYPNERGAKQKIMVSFAEAESACAEAGKRMCRESEWVAACEGPDETPFPYGWQRQPATCNIDNKWVSPILDRVYSEDPEVQRAELSRLDRSLPSGARPACQSGFGVFDLTGNVDEWVRADEDRPHRRSRFAALKGGAWGHVRNACRPVTTSHPPEFKYYFIGFRCCADVPSAETAETGPEKQGG